MSTGWDTSGGFELGTDGATVVLAGVDGSRTSWRAGAWAAGLARRQGARLVVVHVQAPTTLGSLAALTPGAGATVASTAAEIADDIGTEVRDGAARLGLDVDYRVVVGDPLAELSRVADEVHAELVVVGASESAGHRLVGSLAARLVRSGRWPVTVVP
ncbi:universal stress protein [Rhodococcus aerolatus]